MTAALRTLLILATAAGLLAGCSGSVSIGGKRLSGEKIERVIRAKYASDGQTLATLTCRSAALEVGEPISCSGTTSKGVALTFGGSVTAIDADEEGGDFRYQVLKAVAPGSLFEGQIASLVTEKTGQEVAGVSCPPEVEIKLRAMFECTARSAGGTSAPFTITLTDLEGGFNVKPSAG